MTTENDSSPPSATDEAPRVVAQPLNPYIALPQSEVTRIQADIKTSDYYLIKLIRPRQGTINGVIGTLWSKLCQALRENDITDNTKQNEFERFLSTAKIIDSESYARLCTEAAAWRLIGRADSAESVSSVDSAASNRPGSTVDRPLPETAGGNVGKRAKRVRKVHSD